MKTNPETMTNPKVSHKPAKETPELIRYHAIEDFEVDGIFYSHISRYHGYVGPMFSLKPDAEHDLWREDLEAFYIFSEEFELDEEEWLKHQTVKNKLNGRIYDA